MQCHFKQVSQARGFSALNLFTVILTAKAVKLDCIETVYQHNIQNKILLVDMASVFDINTTSIHFKMVT